MIKMDVEGIEFWCKFSALSIQGYAKAFIFLTTTFRWLDAFQFILQSLHGRNINNGS